MSDDDLLIFAAKAAGVGPINFNGLYWYRVKHGDFQPPEWNPLTDDGDCLRMALDLNLQVRFNYTSQIGQNTREEANRIRCAAYRRAAVEMAAEIGKQIK